MGKTFSRVSITHHLTRIVDAVGMNDATAQRTKSSYCLAVEVDEV